MTVIVVVKKKRHQKLARDINELLSQTKPIIHSLRTVNTDRTAP